MPQLVLATRNEGKLREFQSLLTGHDWTVVSQSAFPDSPDVVEDGKTFLENAAKKAVEISQHTGLIAFADDSGLEADALDGAPGVRSARYARGEDSTDEENLQKVLDEIKNVPDEKRTARFVCAVVIALGTKVLFSTRQTVEGYLTRKPSGEGGFGYDPIFFYPPYKKTFAEVSPEEKHAVSHRGQAVRSAVEFLNAFHPH